MATSMTGLVGRDAPLAELAAPLRDAERGRGRAALVQGEAGIGKSTLVEALAARAGGPVAWGWASPDGPPYGPWRTALNALTDNHPLRDASFAPAGGTDGRAARHIPFAAVRDTLARIAAEHGPILLVIEDLHWADQPSLAMLRANVDGLRGVPLMVVATARDDPTEGPPEVTAALRDLPTSVVRVPLYGLTEPEMTTMVARMAPMPADVVTALHRRTGGNPFYAREVTRLMVAQGTMSTGAIPPGVREALDRRLARLTDPCHRHRRRRRPRTRHRRADPAGSAGRSHGRRGD